MKLGKLSAGLLLLRLRLRLRLGRKRTENYWNYRIVRVEYSVTLSSGKVIEDTQYELYEVYYNPDGTINGCSLEKTDINGFDTVKEYKWLAKVIKQAIKKPVLVFNSNGKLVLEKPS